MDEIKKINELENNILNEEAIIKREKVKLTSSPEEKIIEERKKKVFGFIKNNPYVLVIGALLILVALGVFLRSLPMTDHNGQPGLWDITTNSWTLGPDLDPFLFLRYAKEDIANNGSLPRIDMFRNVPLGFDTTTELQMVPHMIILTYKLVNLFGTYSVDFAGVFMPVLFFALTIISFFFFVREIFRKRDEKFNLKANVIATISTLFMIVIPEFISRTIAGIPEKESVGFFFMFLAFYLFLRAWKTEKITYASIIAILAGISTGLMGLTWGGVTYIYVTIGLATLAAFMIDKVKIKETVIYSLWLVSSLALTLLLTNRYSLSGFVTSLDTGLASLVFGILLVNILLWYTKLKEIKFLENSKVPKNIISIIVTIILGIITLSLVFGPSFIIEKVKALNQMFFNPTTGRWNTTVAENRQPYFSEWMSSFGPMIGNLPLLFWLFIMGSIILFKEMLNKIKRKDAWILTGSYILFVFALIFSRYSSSSLFNGENFISKFVYYISGLILAGAILYYYIRYERMKDRSFELIEMEYLFLFALFILCLFSARSAVRLIMVLAPIAPIFLAYLIVKLFEKLKQQKESTNKIIWGIVLIAVIILSAYTFISFYKTAQSQGYNQVPYYYTFQWQEAMSWVRDNTPINSVFAHWWDYGYWVQSIGNRATVTDGGNAISFWNYYVGRFVLTGDNQKEALEFLYTHNATHLLIDSSDMGKYGAFSQIGSDENFDRLSQGPLTFISDQRNIQETKNEVIRIYNMPISEDQVSISPIEEDMIIESNGTKTILFKENTGIIGVSIRYVQNNGSITMKQPGALIYTNGKQIEVPMRYIYYDGKFKDYGSGLNATAYIIQRFYVQSQGLEMDNMGALIYVSPRIMRGLLGQLYLLNDPFGNFKNFELAHVQDDFILQQIKQQGISNIGEFSYYLGLRGPIKIWDITYKGDEKLNPDYLLRTQPDYITWKF